MAVGVSCYLHAQEADPATGTEPAQSAGAVHDLLERLLRRLYALGMALQRAGVGVLAGHDAVGDGDEAVHDDVQEVAGQLEDGISRVKIRVGLMTQVSSVMTLSNSNRWCLSSPYLFRILHDFLEPLGKPLSAFYTDPLR